MKLHAKFPRDEIHCTLKSVNFTNFFKISAHISFVINFTKFLKNSTSIGCLIAYLQFTIPNFTLYSKPWDNISATWALGVQWKCIPWVNVQWIHHPSGFALGMIWIHCTFTLGKQFLYFQISKFCFIVLNTYKGMYL